MPAHCFYPACLQVCSDWDKPFDLTEAEKEQFRQLLPHEVMGLRDVLCSQQHTAEVGRMEGVWYKPASLVCMGLVCTYFV
jgi:hypothetical protein